MEQHATRAILGLIQFAENAGLVASYDRAYLQNLLLDALGMDAPAPDAEAPAPLAPTVTPLVRELSEIAAAKGIIEDTPGARERFETRLCGLITPSPWEVRTKFSALYREAGPRAATNWFYQLCRASDYIRVDQIARNVRFFAPSPAGELEITINLSKPEKDPRDIAAERGAPQVGYPKCMLCVENPGYAGRAGFPARQNHRMIPLTLSAEPWHFQYSPYLYYNEHCIVLSERHTPMKISRGTFFAPVRVRVPVPPLLPRGERGPAHRGRLHPEPRPLPGRPVHLPDGQGRRPDDPGLSGGRRARLDRGLADDLPEADRQGIRAPDRPGGKDSLRLEGPFRPGVRRIGRDGPAPQHRHADPEARGRRVGYEPAASQQPDQRGAPAGHLPPARAAAPHQKRRTSA